MLEKILGKRIIDKIQNYKPYNTSKKLLKSNIVKLKTAIVCAIKNKKSQQTH